MKTAKKKLNFRQQTVLSTISEKLRKGIPIKSKGELLRQAEYAPSVVAHPDIVFDNPTLSSEISRVIKEMEFRRDMALRGIDGEKVGKASAAALAMTVDLLTKNIELLSGRPTERSEEIKTDEETLERIIERSSDGRTRETIRASRRRKR